MSLLMDALRRAEAEKKEAAAQGAATPAAGGLSLEPLETTGERTGERTLERGVEDTYDRLTTRTLTRGRTVADPAATVADGATIADPPAGAFSAAAGQPGPAHPTIVGAQTVFEATRGGGVPRLLVAIIAAAVVLALGLGAIGYYAYHQMPEMPALPSPRVAAQLEIPPASVLPPATPALEPPATELPPLVEPPLPAPPPTPAEVTPAASAPPSPPTEPAAPPPAPEVPSVPAPGGAPLRAEPIVRSLAAPLPKDAEIGRGEVRIARTARPGVDAVTRAYAAFQLGSLDTARSLYQEALARDPQRTDALLGLAAIAMRQNDLAAAHRHYRAVLRLEPRNAVATAALFLIEGGTGDEATEARLKVLADADPESPYLRFALGNLYAKQRRWADAQAAYFAAWSRQQANADYAFNLAVSLDRLGQRKAAVELYRKALALRESGGASFDAAVANARAAELAGPR
jgi:Tfp pilus assembly protein PilF